MSTEKDEVKVEKTAKAEDARQKTSVSEPELVTKADSEHLIYIGPTLPGGLEQNSLFTNGIPERVSKRFEELPELRELFIPVTDFPTGRIEIQEPGTELYAALEAVAKKGVV